METVTPHSTETFQVTTMKLSKFDYVSKPNTDQCLVKIRPLWVAPCIRGIHTSCDYLLPTCLPLSWAPAQVKRINNSTHNGSKHKVWREKEPSIKYFSLLWCFGGHFTQKPPKISQTQPTKRSRIAYKLFKIDKECQLNMNIKSGSPFQTPQSEITRSVPKRQNR